MNMVFMATYVGMHKLQDICGAGSFVHWEWLPCLFALDTTFLCEQIYVALHPFNVHPTHYGLTYGRTYYNYSTLGCQHVFFVVKCLSLVGHHGHMIFLRLIFLPLGHLMYEVRYEVSNVSSFIGHLSNIVIK